MGIEENKDLVRQMYEDVVNKGNIDNASHFISAEAIENEDLSHNGLDSFKNFFKDFRKSFPDLKFTIKDMIAEGDKVVVRMTVTGTHDGDGSFMNFVPRGKKIEIETIDILRFADGKMIEHWGRTDTLCMLEQLDELPTKETVKNIRVDP
jgi:predicted ester cyclase